MPSDSAKGCRLAFWSMLGLKHQGVSQPHPADLDRREVKFRSSLAMRQVRVAVGISLLLGMGLSLIRIHADLQSERNALRQVAVGLLETLERPARRAAYYFDLDLMGEVVDSLARHPLVREARLVTDTPGEQAEWSRPETPGRFGWLNKYFLKDSTFILPLMHAREAEPIGRLEIELDVSRAAENFVCRSILSIAFGIIQNVAVALILTLIFFRLITLPIMQLATAIGRLDLDDRRGSALTALGPDHDDDELGLLAREIERFRAAARRHLAERDQVAQALQHSEQRFRDIAEAASDWYWETDSKHRFTSVSGSVRSLGGISPRRILGKTRWQSAGEDAGSGAWPDHLRDLQARRPFRHFRHSYRDDTGRLRYALVSGRPLFGSEGEFQGYRGCASDITAQVVAEEELRESLRQKEVLLREVHHRVKNNIQGIWGMIQLELSRAPDTPDIRDRLQAIADRVHMLGRLHNELYKAADFSHVSLSNYLEQIVTTLIDIQNSQDRIAVQFEADRLFCGPDTALPLGFIVHELISNSFKYAFPNESAGTIRVVLRFLGCQGVELIVADNGVGIPAGATKGTGSILVEALLQQLGGVRSTVTSGGTEIRMLIPGDQFEVG